MAAQQAPSAQRVRNLPMNSLATRALARELLLPCGTLFVALPPPGRRSRREGESQRQSRRASANDRATPPRRLTQDRSKSKRARAADAHALEGHQHPEPAQQHRPRARLGIAYSATLLPVVAVTPAAPRLASAV